MPLKRKIIRVGNSRAVIIPPDWLKYYEEKAGHPIQDMLMEVNNVITLSIQEPFQENESESLATKSSKKG